MAKREETSGRFSITSPGISERINTSAPSLGVALSKAQTIANRIQRELRATDEEAVSINIRVFDGDVIGRVDVHRDVIATSVLAKV